MNLFYRKSFILSVFIFCLLSQISFSQNEALLKAIYNNDFTTLDLLISANWLDINKEIDFFTKLPSPKMAKQLLNYTLNPEKLRSLVFHCKPPSSSSKEEFESKKEKLVYVIESWKRSGLINKALYNDDFTTLDRLIYADDRLDFNEEIDFFTSLPSIWMARYLLNHKLKSLRVNS